VADYGTQAAWLIGAGITQELGRIPPDDARRYLPAAAAVQKLLSSAEMGELFKVLVLRPARGEASLPGVLAD
jgi:SAM-dependent MidA family methyltransferase